MIYDIEREAREEAWLREEDATWWPQESEPGFEGYTEDELRERVTAACNCPYCREAREWGAAAGYTEDELRWRVTAACNCPDCREDVLPFTAAHFWMMALFAVAMAAAVGFIVGFTG